MRKSQIKDASQLPPSGFIVKTGQNKAEMCEIRTGKLEMHCSNLVELMIFTSLPLKKGRSSIGAPVVLRATGPLV